MMCLVLHLGKRVFGREMTRTAHFYHILKDAGYEPQIVCLSKRHEDIQRAFFMDTTYQNCRPEYLPDVPIIISSYGPEAHSLINRVNCRTVPWPVPCPKPHKVCTVLPFSPQPSSVTQTRTIQCHARLTQFSGHDQLNGIPCAGSSDGSARFWAKHGIVLKEYTNPFDQAASAMYTVDLGPMPHIPYTVLEAMSVGSIPIVKHDIPELKEGRNYNRWPLVRFDQGMLEENYHFVHKLQQAGIEEMRKLW
jgi:hypothetical protein